MTYQDTSKALDMSLPSFYETIDIYLLWISTSSGMGKSEK